ncbi:hypothetical protein NGM99_11455 [Mesorhizobium sp. RP14(2022)]|uniref:LPXTG cell wall anchor domain-containing protein n=1 Tax=Mesorhizobium liriopis TaxID=2953882 RepID=A0ABT1C6W4_9HYPH|nr:hypothetical protein [Mesorhizobium liriopis]MCO6050398.1 hypothetical protein [Mesorhizobium liriopis]
MGAITENLWLIVVAGGPILIAVLIVFALTQRRKRTAAEKQATERATAELYSPRDRGAPPHNN